MKRAAQLQPLSRQHHLGLNLSRHGKECLDTPEDINKHWLNLTGYIDEMQGHFQLEDNLIAKALHPYSSEPDVASALATLDEQHKSLHAIVAEVEAVEGKVIKEAATDKGSPNSKNYAVSVIQVKELATLLYDHIRFEERELFPIVERYLSQEQLDAIYAASSDNAKRLEDNR